MKTKSFPIGIKVSEPLKKQIIKLLQTYAGADNPSKFNWSMVAGFAITSEFAKYLDSNSEKLFGNAETEYNNKTYYPLCMFCYYNEAFNNKAMFELKDELLKNASNKIPKEEDVMKWFYEKHKNELIGLI
jgi:hypothetical protein